MFSYKGCSSCAHMITMLADSQLSLFLFDQPIDSLGHCQIKPFNCELLTRRDTACNHKITKTISSVKTESTDIKANGSINIKTPAHIPVLQAKVERDWPKFCLQALILCVFLLWLSFLIHEQTQAYKSELAQKWVHSMCLKSKVNLREKMLYGQKYLDS